MRVRTSNSHVFAAPMAAPAVGDGAGKAWVISKSNGRPCMGTKCYGKTKEGAYMGEWFFLILLTDPVIQTLERRAATPLSLESKLNLKSLLADEFSEALKPPEL